MSNNTPEIIEGNRLIAEFMGYEHCTDPDHVNDKCYSVPYAKGYHRGHQLQHHTSWDWLMPVVEKICQTVIKGTPPSTGDQFVRVVIVPGGFIRIDNLRYTPIFTNVLIEGGLIQAIYKAVVTFIKWYNLQTPSK